MKYFIFAIVFVFCASTIQAQDFFVPNGAFMPTAEKLKPLNEDQQQLAPYSQRRYKVIDGRVFAIKDEPKEISQEPEALSTDTPDLKVPETALTLEPLPSQNTVTTTPEPVLKTVENLTVQTPQVKAPSASPIDNKLPSYKNRYAQYLQDLQTFQKTKQMPENKELESTLEKLSEPREIVLFQGKLE